MIVMSNCSPQSGDQNRPQSLHWDWRRKAPELRLLAAHGVGVVCEGRWQGLVDRPKPHPMSRDWTLIEEGHCCTSIILKVPPWNWRIPEIGRDGQFRGIGSVLFWNAVQQSREEGFHGRVGLHALPQAEAFYQDGCHMTPLGRDVNKEYLLYFELSRQQAERLFREGEER